MRVRPSWKHSFRLTEYEQRDLPANTFSPKEGLALWRQFDQQQAILQVGFPSPINENRWTLTSNGWVGVLHPSPQVQLLLQSRFSIHNLFLLWAYAYGVNQDRFLKSLAKLNSIEHFPDFLAGWLASEILTLARTGLSKAYVPTEARLPYVRGRITAVSPHTPTVQCQFDQLTTDIADNQILAYTLHLIGRSPLIGEETRPLLRQATHRINQVATPIPIGAEACYGRVYHRLNQKYRLLHHICGFMIEQLSPQHQPGLHQFPTFLLHTPRLFERAVAQWLKQHAPPHWRVELQERVTVGDATELMFQIDIVLYNKSEQKPLAVLDTKYKRGNKIAAADIHQIISYAKLKSSQTAVLIYPTAEESSLDVRIDDIRLKALMFDLNKPLNDAGNALLTQLSKLI